MANDINDIIKQYSSIDNDFGFTSEDDVAPVQLRTEERMKAIEDLIMPLLVNLLKTADKPMINWPDRKPILEEKIRQLLELTRE